MKTTDYQDISTYTQASINQDTQDRLVLHGNKPHQSPRTTCTHARTDARTDTHYCQNQNESALMAKYAHTYMEFDFGRVITLSDSRHIVMASPKYTPPHTAMTSSDASSKDRRFLIHLQCYASSAFVQGFRLEFPHPRRRPT